LKIQEGGGRHLEQSKNRHISAMDGLGLVYGLGKRLGVTVGTAWLATAGFCRAFLVRHTFFSGLLSMSLVAF